MDDGLIYAVYIPFLLKHKVENGNINNETGNEEVWKSNTLSTFDFIFIHFLYHSLFRELLFGL